MRISAIVLFLVLLVSSCADRIICPAFQSTYILDDSVRMAYYSYAWKLDKPTRDAYFASLSQSQSLDSTNTPNSLAAMLPYYQHAGQYVQPAETVSRNKYGMVKYEPEWLTRYQLRTAPMQNVMAPPKVEPVSLTPPVDTTSAIASIGFAETSDSLTQIGLTQEAVIASVDSTAEQKPVKPKQQYRYGYDPKDNFNVEQEYYNKYFGKQLLAPKPNLQAPVSTLAPAPKETETKKEKETKEKAPKVKKSKLQGEEEEATDGSDEQPDNEGF